MALRQGLVPAAEGAQEVRFCACGSVAQCSALRVSDAAHSVLGDAETSRAHLCRHRLRYLGFAQPEQAISRAESALLACSCAADERSVSPRARALGEDAGRCAVCRAYDEATAGLQSYPHRNETYQNWSNLSVQKPQTPARREQDTSDGATLRYHERGW